MESGKGPVPKWLPGFLLHDYFTECTEHSHNSNVKSRGVGGGAVAVGDHHGSGNGGSSTKKGDRNYYCMECCKGPLCETGRQLEHPGHYVLQVRKASHTDAIRINDIATLIDIAHIQTYTINGAKIVFLPSRPQAKPAKGAPRYCEMCHRSLQDLVRFCSLSCKLKAMLATPADSSLSLAAPAPTMLLKGGGFHFHAGGGDEISGGSDGTTLTGVSDSLRPASPSPATPAKKRARSSGQAGAMHHHQLEVDGPILRILKLKREQYHAPIGAAGDQLPHSESPTSVLSRQDLNHLHSRAADLESTSSHAHEDDDRDDVLDFVSFRKRPRKGVAFRAPGVGIVRVEGIYA